MDIAETAAILNDLYAKQYQDNLAANEANRRLADEKISYQNEARGTYYSGQPTWERAQNAITYADKANTINLNYANQQNKIWNSVQDYLDRINAYNEATSRRSNTTTPSTSGLLDPNTYYSISQGYQFKDANGNPITANTWANITNQNVWDVIAKMADNKDINAKRALAGYNNANKQLTAEERMAFKILGLDDNGYGSRM